jgi:antitoxin (DNA-binding transcriptional repressor) of toxin-antitoxin stability system
VITRHGRFVAMLSPLAAGQVESAALSRGPVAEELRRRQAAESEPSLSADDLESRMDTWS